jgi:hypothetical protein
LEIAMSLHPFATRDLAEAYLNGLGFTHDPATDVWAAPDGHRLGYIVRDGATFSVTITSNRTVQLKVVPTTKGT